MQTSASFQPGTEFLEPSWSAPLDLDEVLRAVPAAATISGMFIAPLAMEAKRLNVVLPSARDRYLPFRFYPLAEHVRILIEACEGIHASLPVRQALRKLGRGAPKALAASTLGKVVFAAAETPHEMIEAMAKAYPLNARPSRVEVIERGPRRAVVRLEDLHYFVDSHHVGVFEGTLRHAGVQASVLVAPRGRAAADLHLTWTG